MRHLTKQKISLLLNDIYLKSKKNETFKPSEIIPYYHLGRQLSVILHKFGYVKVLDRGVYFYIGQPVTDKLVEEVYQHYFEYRKDQRSKEKKKAGLLFGEKIPNYNQKNKENNAGHIGSLSEIRNRIPEITLNKKIDELEKQIMDLSKELKNLNTAMYTIKDAQDRAINNLYQSSETPKKSFISKLFS